LVAVANVDDEFCHRHDVLKPSPRALQSFPDSNTFRFQAATKKRAEQIALDTARGDAKKLKALRWDVTVRVAKDGGKWT